MIKIHLRQHDRSNRLLQHDLACMTVAKDIQIKFPKAQIDIEKEIPEKEFIKGKGRKYIRPDILVNNKEVYEVQMLFVDNGQIKGKIDKIKKNQLIPNFVFALVIPNYLRNIPYQIRIVREEEERKYNSFICPVCKKRRRSLIAVIKNSKTKKLKMICKFCLQKEEKNRKKEK